MKPNDLKRARMQQKVLFIEDNKTVQYFVKDKIEKELGLNVVVADCKATALEALQSETFFIVLADLTLPDATETEIIDAVIPYNLPVIVFTGSYSEALREAILKRDVLEYVIKDTASSFDYALRLIHFVHFNRDSAMLIVDDSRTARLHLIQSLRRLPMQILEANSGLAALEQLAKHPNIKLMITDKQMPGMDGIELLGRVRRDHALNDLAIIGVSDDKENHASLEFLKAGANDFIKKPVTPEELFTRVVTNIEMLDYIKMAKDAATRDYMTGLHNRRYLFEAGAQLYANARRKNLSMAVGMLDIDHFKKINDTYGHEAGDKAIKLLADALKENLRETDIVARYGGEEFCILFSNCSLDNAVMTLERIRLQMESLSIDYKTHAFGLTISAGISDRLNDSLERMIDDADQALYRAKEGGRNRTVTSA